MSTQDPTINDYEIRVSINVGRKKDQWASDSLAHVEASENLTVQRREIKATVSHLVTEALNKALRAIEIKHGFEQDMLTLNAGDEAITVEAK